MSLDIISLSNTINKLILLLGMYFNHCEYEFLLYTFKGSFKCIPKPKPI